MATVTEIDPAPYVEIVRMLLQAGARVPERVVGEHGPRAAVLLGELGIGPDQLAAFHAQPPRSYRCLAARHWGHAGQHDRS